MIKPGTIEQRDAFISHARALKDFCAGIDGCCECPAADVCHDQNEYGDALTPWLWNLDHDSADDKREDARRRFTDAARVMHDLCEEQDVCIDGSNLCPMYGICRAMEPGHAPSSWTLPGDES